VYHVLQPVPEESSAEDDLAALDNRITNLRSQLAASKTTEKTLKLHLTALSNVMSTEELHAKVSQLQSEKKHLLERVPELQQVNVKPVSAVERATVEEAHRVWSKHVSARKRVCKELWWKCLEIMPEGETADELWVRSIKLWGHTRCALRADSVDRNGWDARVRGHKRGRNGFSMSGCIFLRKESFARESQTSLW
jgi:26S proteasome regulatory subunit, ATPase 3, interacting protein